MNLFKIASKAEYCRALGQSFYNKKIYNNASSNWKGFAFTYLSLLSIVFTFFIIFATYFRVTNWLNEANTQAIASQIPYLYFKDGKFKTLTNKRIDISNPKTHKVILILDPQNTIEESQIPYLAGTGKENKTKRKIILQSSKLFFPFGKSGELKSWNISQLIGDCEINGFGLLKFIQNVINFGLIFIALSVFLFAYFYILVRALFVMLILKIFRYKLSSKSTLRLLILASTPSVIISSLFFALNIRLGKFESPFFAILFFIYVYLALYWAKSKD